MMTESELFELLSAHARQRFVSIGSGPLSLEAYDDEQRLCWRGHYRTASELHDLLDQLALERELSL